MRGRRRRRRFASHKASPRSRRTRARITCPRNVAWMRCARRLAVRTAPAARMRSRWPRKVACSLVAAFPGTRFWTSCRVLHTVGRRRLSLLGVSVSVRHARGPWWHGAHGPVAAKDRLQLHHLNAHAYRVGAGRMLLLVSARHPASTLSVPFLSSAPPGRPIPSLPLGAGPQQKKKKMKSIHSPRLCRVAVFLIQTNVSLMPFSPS